MAAIRHAFNKLWQSNTVRDGTQEHDGSSGPGEDLSYEARLDRILPVEYPTLADTTYLDHAGTTPYANSVIESWTQELTTNLFGNPHSASAASQLSTRRVEDLRLRVLRFFNADPADFEVVFVANATAAIKLVAEAFRDLQDGFRYLYHVEAHTSLVGVRELAVRGSKCLKDDGEVDDWLAETASSPVSGYQLLGYPGQSNMTGLQLSMQWCVRARLASATSKQRVYTLFDAASLAATSPLDLSNVYTAPDFTALSFYKIFGFPDLGALIVRKQSAGVLMQKRYFAGGTVDSVVTVDEPWHVKRLSIHAALEEGTLPFHNILALDHALAGHGRLFGSMSDVARHSSALAERTRASLTRLHHGDGASVCQLYMHAPPALHGPTIAFNLLDRHGAVISAMEVEKIAIVRGIQFRTGGLCNPGGIAAHLALSPDQIRSHYQLGYRCDGENDIIDGKPTSVIRVSFGATSTQKDSDRLLDFIREYFVDQTVSSGPLSTTNQKSEQPRFLIDSLSVFPIKSCAAYNIPKDQKWQITANGLAWDREWCVIHEGTNTALSQKRFPQMALLKPHLDLVGRRLRVSYSPTIDRFIEVSLDDTASTVMTCTNKCESDGLRLGEAKVCNDQVAVHVYTSEKVRAFFSEALGTPCTLARHSTTQTKRYTGVGATRNRSNEASTPIKLSNESPILVINSASVDKLNAQIMQSAEVKDMIKRPVSAVSPATFRANIVVRPIERDSSKSSSSSTTSIDSDPSYLEDTWSSLVVSPSPLKSPAQSQAPIPTPVSGSSSGSKFIVLNILSPCRRCQMLSVCQTTGMRQQEPFCTLAKTRRRSGAGGVFFGVHAALERQGKQEDEGTRTGSGSNDDNDTISSNKEGSVATDVPVSANPRDSSQQISWIKVGDLVQPRT